MANTPEIRTFVAFFGVDRTTEPVSRFTRARVGGWLVALAVIGLTVFSITPSPYVIERPGPVFNTLESVTINGEKQPLIDIPVEKTYPTGGALDLLTVSALGDRQSLPSWWEVALAWFDPSETVLPVDAVYPPGYTIEQSNEDGRIQMANSQKDAVAAALTELGYDLPRTVTIGALSESSPSEGILEAGDVLVSVNGTPITDVDGLRRVIADSGAGKPLPITIIRNGSKMDVSVTPELSTQDPQGPVIGVYPSIDYTFPFEVKIQLQNVGGPSGGQMFALGIIDKLTPGQLNGGKKVAGTGTITVDGTVGAIGGIRQKLYGAANSGATWFLAPKSNCNEVVGHVPDGMKVVAVGTLSDSLAALKAIETGTGTKALPSCANG
ncbi:MAG: S16 family serine protease [Terrimesophilobacter sp.]